MKHLSHLTASLSSVSLAVLTGLFISPNVQAASNDQATKEMESIQITASRRATSIEDTGMSVSAVSGESLEQLGATNFADFIRTVPGLNFSESAAPGTQDIIIRGVNFPSNRFQMPTVSVYLDEINLSQNGRNPDIDLIDVQRVEVLRGPQGTLYGGSAMGGALRYITNKADTSGIDYWFEAGLEQTKNGGLGNKQSLMFNTPLSDDAALRVVAYRKDLDGWIDNLGYIHTGDYEIIDPNTGEENYNDENTVGGRVSLRWDASDNLTLDFMAAIHNVEVDGLANWNPNLISKGNNGAGYGSYKAAVRDKEAYQDDNTILNFTATYDADFAEISWISSLSKRDYQRISDVSRERHGIDWWVGDFSSKFDYNLDSHVDESGQPLSSVRIRPIDYKSTSHELRFVGSAFDDKLNWVAGAIYAKRDNLWQQREVYEGLESAYSSFVPFGFSTNYEQAALDNPNEFGVIGTDLWFYSDREEEIEESAAYLNLTYSLSDAWQISVGSRFFDVEVSNNYQQGGIFGGTYVSLAKDDYQNGLISENQYHQIIADNVASNYHTEARFLQQEDDASFMFNTSYDFGDTLVYATIAEGYRIGGVNRAFPIRDGSLTVPQTFDSDSLVSSELGLKSQLFNRALTLDMSAYQIDWQDIQFGLTDPVTSFDFNINAGAAEINGLEVSALWQATSDLEFSASATLLDHQVTELSDAALGQNINVGDAMLGVSDERFALAVSYYTEVFEQDAYVRLDWNYTGDYIRDYVSEDDSPEVIAAATGDAYAMTTLASGFSYKNWDISVFIRNLFDEDTIVSQEKPRVSYSGGRYSDVSSDPGRVVTLKPRTIGVNVRYRFE
ncbi:TonB-dependent receptor [Pseudoalteromonas sp. SSM20]|uniref:TonB-dependent receptor n=1 Tax=Pseudoalteromonas sp. SSM20 TaxID=3139394 RepID=UPI003BABDF16